MPGPSDDARSSRSSPEPLKDGEQVRAWQAAECRIPGTSWHGTDATPR